MPGHARVSPHSPARRLRQLALALAVLLPVLPGSAQTSLEAKVKAAYIFNLTRFVEWPTLPADSIHICVLGNSPVGQLLTELGGRQVKERTLRIDHNGNLDLARCQVLFIADAAGEWREVLAGAQNLSLLTVSDLEGFARGGGIVGFYRDKGKIRLEINPRAASQANLRISAKIMEIARAVP